MATFAKKEYEFYGKYPEKGLDEWAFTQSIPEASSPVKVTLTLAERNIVVVGEFDMSDQLIMFLETTPSDFKNLSESLASESYSITMSLHRVVKSLIEAMKYHLRNRYIRETLGSKGTWWSKDGNAWRVWPQQMSCVVSSEAIPVFKERECKIIQKCLNEHRPALLGMRHLHRAMNEPQPRYKWIDATIAAELAIKEFFAIKFPETQILLLELPSPPLGKLYGKVLKAFCGQESPMRKILDNGAVVRNELIHKPTEKKIDLQEANDYVESVDVALLHLMSMLYPDDEGLKGFYEQLLGIREYELKEGGKVGTRASIQ